MAWLILRTDARKEAYVARQVQNMGFEAWLPVQLVACRPQIARRITAKAQLAKIREIPILPRRVFASIEFGIARDWPAIRHMVGIEHDSAGAPITIPASQIAAFRAEIDRENTAALALASRPSRKQKAKWKSLHDALCELIQSAREQLEQAA